jgi:hypothetical protein
VDRTTIEFRFASLTHSPCTDDVPGDSFFADLVKDGLQHAVWGTQLEAAFLRYVTRTFYAKFRSHHARPSSSRCPPPLLPALLEEMWLQRKVNAFSIAPPIQLEDDDIEIAA